MASQVYENKQAFEQLFEKSFHHEALYGSAILTAEKNIMMQSLKRVLNTRKHAYNESLYPSSLQHVMKSSGMKITSL